VNTQRKQLQRKKCKNPASEAVDQTELGLLMKNDLHRMLFSNLSFVGIDNTHHEHNFEPMGKKQEEVLSSWCV